MIDRFINILLNYLFDTSLKPDNKLAYIEFLGLCKNRYKKGFKSNIEMYEYIKESHYFNSSFFKHETDFYNYLKCKPKQIEFSEYKFFYINVDIKEFDKILTIDKQYFDNFKIQYQKALLINFFDKYQTLKYTLDKSLLKIRLERFIKIYRF